MLRYKVVVEEWREKSERIMTMKHYNFLSIEIKHSRIIISSHKILISWHGNYLVACFFFSCCCGLYTAENFISMMNFGILDRSPRKRSVIMVPLCLIFAHESYRSSLSIIKFLYSHFFLHVFSMYSFHRTDNVVFHCWRNDMFSLKHLLLKQSSSVTMKTSTFTQLSSVRRSMWTRVCQNRCFFLLNQDV